MPTSKPEPKRPASTKPAPGGAGGCCVSNPKKPGKARQSSAPAAAPAAVPPGESPLAISIATQPRATLRKQWARDALANRHALDAATAQRAEDFLDDSWFLDDPDEDEFAGGLIICSPDNGPRSTQEDIRGLVRELRTKAMAVLGNRAAVKRQFAAASVKVLASLDSGSEEYGENFTEADWIAYLYESGMRTVKGLLFAVSDQRWPHAMFMLASVKDHLQAMERAQLRAPLLLAHRAKLAAAAASARQSANASRPRKLTADEVLEIVRQLRAGQASGDAWGLKSELARRFGVTRQTIDSIARKQLTGRLGK